MPSNATNRTVTGLVNGQEYLFRVAAVNSVGTGPFSGTTAVTPAYVPEAVIVSGYVNPTYGRTGGDTTLTLAGTSNGRPYYTAGNDAVSWTGSAWLYSYYGDTFATNSSNTALPPTSGWSHQGMTLWLSTAGEPLYPTAALASSGNNKLTLTWSAPAVNGSGSITGYTVEYTPAGGSAQTVNTGSNATTYELTGLTNDTSYSVRVAAINAYGTGPWSAAASGTPAYIPESIVLSGYVNPVYGRNGDPVTLTLSGTSNGRPNYVSGNDAVSWTGSVWRYSYYGDTFATNSNNTTLPPNTGWSDPNIVVTGGASVPPVISITSQPSNQTASNGSATFSVTATVTQSATLSYQWQKQESGSGSFTNVSGATSSSLALSNLTNADDDGDVYRCVVSATGGAESVTSSSATLTVAASGPLIGGGQILNSFALSGAPNPWGNVVDVNGTYVDEGSLSPASPGYGWVIDDGSSQYGGNLRITWWSDQGSCTCYDGNYNVLGTRQLGAGWVLWGGYSDMIAFAPGPNASIPPSTGWYKIYMAGGTPACSGPFGGDGSTAYGFSDCDPSIQPPTENWQPGFVTNLTFTPA